MDLTYKEPDAVRLQACCVASDRDTSPWTQVAVSGLAASELRGSLRVGGATVVAAEVFCTSGVIHVIDRVLIPAD
ncbi:MAG: fasciclin domain-containing protein [Bryobacteraceae bacterium]